jgi:Protein of unknown function (DUF4058)
MPSPFPGMDPFLEGEQIWPSFQHHFVACLYQTLVPGLVERYRARVGQRRFVTEQALFTSIVRQDHEEEYIEIRQRKDSRLVTLLEVISPANKITVAGRQAYLDKRKEARAANANLVEIDLLMQGQPLLEYSREGLPEWDHSVTVTRAVQPQKFEIYKASLQERLPKFKLPLASDDRDNILDLQAIFARCFDQANFTAQIDYLRDPPTKLDDNNRRWIDELLRRQNLRT